jgi:hypothetical protein
MPQPVIAVPIDCMHTPGMGKLQPLFYADGQPIRSMLDEFPNTGDILVYHGFHEIPDEVVEVSYGPNGRPPTIDASKYCQFAVGGAKNCRVTDRYLDVIKLEDFPVPGGPPIQIRYRPTPFFFVATRDGDLRGPYKRGDIVVDGSWYRVPVMPIEASDGASHHVRWAKDSVLAEVTVAQLPAGTLITCQGLGGFQLNYNERIFANAQLLWPALKAPDTKLVDVMSTEAGLSWVRTLIQQRPGVDAKEAKRFRELVLDLRETPQFKELPLPLAQQRMDRLLARIDTAIDLPRLLQGFEVQLLERYGATEEGRAFLQRFVLEHELDLVAHLQTRSAEADERLHDELIEKVAALQSEKERLTAALERQANQVVIPTDSPEILASLGEELNQLQQQIAAARQEAAFQERLREDLTRANETLEETLKMTNARLKERLAEFKTFVDVLSGMPARGERRGAPSFRVAPAPPQPGGLSELVETVRRFLRASGRHVTTSQTANYLVSVMQSRITVLVGYPGVGKTSMAKLLSSSLGLAPDTEEKRLLTISVGRGWVSSRDLLGVYNPLMREFQPADTGLFPALEALDGERDSDAAVPLWVLLDEMNLSPVEHYWSDFLTQADAPEGSVTVGGRTLRFGPALRFIGTVNYDETTETLSPRLISRSHVLYMEPPDARQLGRSDGDGASLPTGACTMETLRPIWDAGQGGFEDQEIEVFNRLADLLQSRDQDGHSLGRPFHLDSRVVTSVKRYCHVARPLMTSERGPLGAIDFAIAQRVLPQLRGSGDGVRYRLDALKRYFESQNLTQSAQAIARTIQAGEAYHEYDFFSF